MILAIDPGNKESGFALIDDDYKPCDFGKVTNGELENYLQGLFYTKKGEQISKVVVEMVASYGMPAGETLFETCVAIGRFEQIAEWFAPVMRVKRKQYVTDLCGSAKAKDSNVIQYLVDRFAPDTPNRGKGTKKAPGFFYGFSKDAWQAFALAVWCKDKEDAK